MTTYQLCTKTSIIIFIYTFLIVVIVYILKYIKAATIGQSEELLVKSPENSLNILQL